MNEIMTVLGKNIRELRIKSGWTQEKLAEKAGISVPVMTQILRIISQLIHPH